MLLLSGQLGELQGCSPESGWAKEFTGSRGSLTQSTNSEEVQVRVQAAQGSSQKGLSWARLGLPLAAAQVGETQKFRLSRASESWLMSRQ